MLWYDASYRWMCVQASMSSPLHNLSYRRLSVLICLQAPVSLSSCFCSLFSAAPLRIACLTLLINVEWRSRSVTLPASWHGIFHVKTARFVRWHHSLPTVGSEIALSARISVPSFAGPSSPWCAFTLTKKVAVPAAILFRSISMAAARISTSGTPTNAAFPPSPTSENYTSVYMSLTTTLYVV